MPTKVIRVLSFAPDLENPDADDTLAAERGEDEADDPADVPEVNVMRSQLIQLIAMLEGEPELEDDLPVEVEQGVAEDLGLQEWLSEDEWESAEEGEDGPNGTQESSLEELD